MDAAKIYRLHELLQARRAALPVAAIVEQLQCSERTVKRVFRFMRDHLRAPLEYDRETSGYRYGNQGYELPGLWFSAAEMLALLSLQKLLAELGVGLLANQLAPLKNRIESILHSEQLSEECSKRIRLLPMAARAPNLAHFQVVAGALLQRQRLEIIYLDRSANSLSERVVSPQRLVHYRDNWHLDAWCHERRALRNFAMDRVQSAKALKTRALDIAEAKLQAHFAPGYGIFAGAAKHTAVLRFSPVRSRWVADETWHPQQQSRWLTTGQYELRFPYSDPRELVMDILRHIPEVEVVSPTSLRAEILTRLQAGLIQHQSAAKNSA